MEDIAVANRRQEQVQPAHRLRYALSGGRGSSVCWGDYRRLELSYPRFNSAYSVSISRLRAPLVREHQENQLNTDSRCRVAITRRLGLLRVLALRARGLGGAPGVAHDGKQKTDRRFDGQARSYRRVR